jgi:hypothetical protein
VNTVILLTMDVAFGQIRPRSLVATCLLSLVAAPLFAAPAASTPATNASATNAHSVPWATVQSVFHISKSENRNEVHYAVRVDAGCHAVGRQPLFGYWRDFEKGPRAVSPLLSHEQPAYGLTPPRSIEQTGVGSRVRISLRAFPERLLTVETQRQAASCAARAVTTIQKQPAMLISIFVQIGFLFSVEYAVVRGPRLSDGAPVQEKIND